MGGTQSAHLHHRDPRARHHDRPAQHFPQQPHCFGNLTFDTTPRQGLDAWPAPPRRAWIQHPQAPAHTQDGPAHIDAVAAAAARNARSP